jgi:hypothetical protein
MSKSAAEAARAIVATMKGMYGAPHTVVPVDEAQFKHLQLDRYRSVKSMLEAQGFRYIADLEILQVSQSPTSLIARTMIRSMVSQDGHVVADYYQIRPRTWRRLKLLGRGLLNLRLFDAPQNFLKGMGTRHCIGFETEFDDGRFLITSNAESASKVSMPPTIERVFFPYGTPPSVVYSAHAKRLADVLGGSHVPKPVVIESLADLLQMQKRQNAQKIAHRAAMQWVTKSELEGLSNGNQAIADAVFEEVQKLLEQEQGTT